jgi:hypothetical protein
MRRQADQLTDVPKPTPDPLRRSGRAESGGGSHGRRRLRRRRWGEIGSGYKQCRRGRLGWPWQTCR